jgi:hypothetical protein
VIILKRQNKGDKYRPTVTVEKMKGDVPSVLTIGGRKYMWDSSTRAVSKKGWNDRSKYKKE